MASASHPTLLVAPLLAAVALSLAVAACVPADAPPFSDAERAEVVAAVDSAVRSFRQAEVDRDGERALAHLWPDFYMYADGVRSDYGSVRDNILCPETEWTEVEVVPLGRNSALSSFLFRDSIILTEACADAGTHDADLGAPGRPCSLHRMRRRHSSSRSTPHFFEMKARILRFLVEEMDFEAFAIEATWPEANRLDRYVRYGEGDPEVLLSGLYFWTWNTESVLEMIQWMRAHNEAGGDVGFYGFDMQFPGMALHNVFEYMRAVDPDRLTEVATLVDCLTRYANGPDGRSRIRATGTRPTIIARPAGRRSAKPATSSSPTGRVTKPSPARTPSRWLCRACASPFSTTCRWPRTPSGSTSTSVRAAGWCCGRTISMCPCSPAPRDGICKGNTARRWWWRASATRAATSRR